MVVLCVARHLYLAQHLARVLAQAGAVTRAAVGFDEARAVAQDCAPDVIAAEYDLLVTLPRRAWDHDEVLSRRPVVAVSLTRRPGESNVLDKNGIGGYFYLPKSARRWCCACCRQPHRPESARPTTPSPGRRVPLPSRRPDRRVYALRPSWRSGAAAIRFHTWVHPRSRASSTTATSLRQLDAYRRDPSSVDESWRQFFRLAEQTRRRYLGRRCNQPTCNDSRGRRRRLAHGVDPRSTGISPYRSIRSAVRRRARRS